MKPFRLLFKFSILSGLMLFIGVVVNGASRYSVANGNWGSTGTWSATSGGASGATVPVAGDIVSIENNHSVTIAAIASCATLNIASGSTLTVSGAFAFTVSGATSVTGNFNLVSSGAQTFGAVTVNSGGNLIIPNTANTILVTSLTVSSGGTLIHNQNYVSSNYLGVSGNLLISGTYNYAGYAPAIFMNGAGTVNINTGTTSVFYLLLRTANYFATGPVTVDGPFYAMWNVNAGSFHTNGQTVVANWGVINSGGTLYIDGVGTSLTIYGANGGLLTGHTVGGQNGTVSMSAGTLTSPGLYIGITGTATFTAAFTQSAGIANISDPLVIDNISSYNLSGGTLNILGGLTINSPSSLICTNSPPINIAGNWSNSGTFTAATSTVTFNGTTSQSIGGGVSSTFNNLAINNSAGVTCSLDQNVNSTLTLTNGDLNILTNNLILGPTASAVAGSLFSAAKMIIADGGGEVRKKFAAGTISGSYLFPIGDNSGTAEYSPITLNFTSGTAVTGAYAGVKVTDAKHPNNASTTDYLTRYWTLSNSGVTSPSLTATATYLTADITGTEANIAGAKYTGSLPWTKYGVIGSNTLSTTAITNTGAGIAITGISNLPPTVTISGGGVTICSGSTTASLSSIVVNATNSISYLWSPTTGLSSSTVSNPVANPASTTLYTLTVTDGNGFTGSASTTITVTSPPAAPTASVTAQPTCTLATGTITITAPTGAGMTYSTDGVTYSNTTGVFPGMAAGSYNLTAKNSGGCISSISSVTVNAQPPTPAAPTASVTAQPTCTLATGTITITAPTGAGMTYSTDGVTYSNTTGVFPGMAAGSYNLTAKNSGGCISSISSVTVNAQPPTPATPTITAGSSTTFCTGGSVTLTSSAGTSYLWSTGATTASISPTASGSYTVKVTNASGCQSASSAATVVTVNPLPAAPTASVTAQPTCTLATGTITITAPTGAGMTYSTDGVTYSNTTGVFPGMAAGSYNLTAKNSGGCISSISSVTVNAQPPTPAAPTASVTAQPTCTLATGTITITAPTGAGMTYSTDGVTYSNTTGVFPGMAAGSYNLTAKNSGGCISSISSVTVNAQPPTPAAPTASVTLSLLVLSATGTITIHRSYRSRNDLQHRWCYLF